MAQPRADAQGDEGVNGGGVAYSQHTRSASISAAAYASEGLLIVAFGALLFGKFCLGAYVYHLLSGNVAFANGTCPWSD